MLTDNGLITCFLHNNSYIDTWTFLVTLTKLLGMPPNWMSLIFNTAWPPHAAIYTGTIIDRALSTLQVGYHSGKTEAAMSRLMFVILSLMLLRSSGKFNNLAVAIIFDL